MMDTKNSALLPAIGKNSVYNGNLKVSFEEEISIFVIFHWGYLENFERSFSSSATISIILSKMLNLKGRHGSIV